MNKKEIIKDKIIDYVKKFYKSSKKELELGDKIPYAGRVYDEKELINLVEASLEFWLTAGRWTTEFEKKLSQFLNIKNCLFVNSGSSANLLAFMTLTAPELGKKAIKPGDEIITVASSFPTTVAPIVQYGAVPVFVDIIIPQYNIDVNQLKKALSKKTKAVMLAHTLGNPFNILQVKNFCKENNLWLIEDNCDSLGAQYNFKEEWKYTGTFGDIATSSFYPAHHITTGEGGAVYTDNDLLFKIALSMRDWGRDCWCKPGKDNTCGKRFKGKFGNMPFGYDHKYIYSHFGYNLKATDLQAAIGCAQIEKLPDFIKKRNENWQYLKNNLNDFNDFFILPESEKNSKPSWFGFLLTIKNKKVKRDEIINYLESKKIQTRMLFAGNIVKQPCFTKSEINYKIIGNLKNTDIVMQNSFWIGVYPRLTFKELDIIIKEIRNFIFEVK
jgi:CDP-6-deoxy-D-xylo-4-hexulose-3-dehydrase